MWDIKCKRKYDFSLYWHENIIHKVKGEVKRIGKFYNICIIISYKTTEGATSQRVMTKGCYVLDLLSKNKKNSKTIHSFSIVFTLVWHLPPLGVPPVRVIT